jgi:hypothetical protein
MEGTDARRGARGWTGLTAAFVAALGALAIAPAAWADDTMPASPIPVIADVSAVAQTAEAALSTGGVAATMSEVDSTVSAALSESEFSPESGDTTSEARDTAADIAESLANTGESSANTGDARTHAASASNPGAQVGAANVNVSIRIDSPGNDGAVSQSNIAGPAAQIGTAAALTAARPTSSTASSQLSGPTRDTLSQSASSSPVGASTAAGTWNWTWDCASPLTIDAPALVDANGQAIPWNWTWIWNCGGNTQSATSPNSQYHSATDTETTAQYQPLNVNISIRINSPGDNGAVNQANVAISVATAGMELGAVAAGVTSQVEVHLDMQLSASSERGSDASSSVSDATIASELRAVGIALGAWPTPFGLTLTMARDGSFVLTPCRCTRTTDPELSWVVPIGPCGRLRHELHGLLGSMRRDDEWFERCLDAPLSVAPCRCLPPGTPLTTSVASGEGSEGSENGSTVPPEATVRPRTAPARHGSTVPWNGPPIPVGVSGAALGPAPSGSSSGSALPASLLIPLAFAVLDLCRRVAVAKVVWPAGRRGGTFDPPG